MPGLGENKKINILEMHEFPVFKWESFKKCARSTQHGWIIVKSLHFLLWAQTATVKGHPSTPPGAVAGLLVTTGTTISPESRQVGKWFKIKH